jgi:hypothetical protein
MDWPTIVKSAQAGFEKGVNEWILRARVKVGRVQGPTAELTPGSLSSDVNFEASIQQVMAATRVPTQVSQILARELWSAWKEWADGFRMTISGAFPTFAAFPGPQAPPTRAAQPGYPLARGSSGGEYRLQAATLQSRLTASLRTTAPREVLVMGTELGRLSTWVEASFRDWKTSAQIMGLTGQGPVPAFAPPYVPVGPVVGGDNIATPGNLAALLAGPRFGKPGL